MKTCTASPKDTSHGQQVGARGGVGAAAGGLDEEVQQRRLLARAGHEQVAAGARVRSAAARPPRRRARRRPRRRPRCRPRAGCARRPPPSADARPPPCRVGGTDSRSDPPRGPHDRGQEQPAACRAGRPGADRARRSRARRRAGAAAPGAGRPSPRPARGDRRRARRASRRPTAGTSTRTATSAAACSAARASPSRRRAKRPELEPPLRWRPCTSRLPTFESPQGLAREDAGRVAAEAHEQHADRPLAADVVEQRAGLVAGALAADGGVERRERRLAHHPLAVGADEGHVALADRRPRDVLVALRPAIQPALEARRRQLVAVLGQAARGVVGMNSGTSSSWTPSPVWRVEAGRERRSTRTSPRGSSKSRRAGRTRASV